MGVRSIRTRPTVIVRFACRRAQTESSAFSHSWSGRSLAPGRAPPVARDAGRRWNPRGSRRQRSGEQTGTHAGCRIGNTRPSSGSKRSTAIGRPDRATVADAAGEPGNEPDLHPRGVQGVTGVASPLDLLGELSADDISAAAAATRQLGTGGELP